jgi:hypothetical protein
MLLLLLNSRQPFDKFAIQLLFQRCQPLMAIATHPSGQLRQKAPNFDLNAADQPRV